jgi:hypothetical protein
MAGEHTRGAQVRLKFVFLEDKLVVDFLNVGEVKVWLCYEKRRLRCVNLYQRVSGTKRVMKRVHILR